MNKLYEYKNWYSINEAARRLSENCNTTIDRDSLIQLTIEGHIKLYWHIRRVSGQEVTLQTIKIKKDFDNDCKDYIHITDWFPIEDEPYVTPLYGAHELILQNNYALKDYLFGKMEFREDTDLVAIDGFYVRNKDGKILQILEMYDEPYLQEIKKRHPDLIRVADKRNYFPTGEFPDLSELGFIKEELEGFEKKFNANNNVKSARGRKPKYDWEQFLRHIVIIANTPDGLPDVMAELETKMADWCNDNWGEIPAESMIREKISPIYKDFSKADK